MNRRDIAWGGTVAALAAVAGAVASTPALADDTGDVLAAIEEFRKAMVDGNGGPDDDGRPLPRRGHCKGAGR